MRLQRVVAYSFSAKLALARDCFVDIMSGEAVKRPLDRLVKLLGLSPLNALYGISKLRLVDELIALEPGLGPFYVIGFE